VARDLQLRRRLIEAALRLLGGEAAQLERLRRGPAALGERAVAREIAARLAKIGLGGGDLGLRRAERRLEVGRVKPGQDLTRGNAVADLDPALDDLAADAEAEIRLPARPHRPRIALLGRDRDQNRLLHADRDRRRLLLRSLAAGGEEQQREGCGRRREMSLYMQIHNWPRWCSAERRAIPDLPAWPRRDRAGR